MRQKRGAGCGVTFVDELQMGIYRVVMVLEENNVVVHSIEEDFLWPRAKSKKANRHS